LDAQDESVRLIEAVAADFLAFQPQLAPPGEAQNQAILVIGSESGFCGDFNEELLGELGQNLPSASAHEAMAGPVRFIAVGSKLCARLEKHPALAGQFDGPTVAEDVPLTLNRLVVEIGRLQQGHGSLGLIVLHHRSGAEAIERKHLLPPFAQVAKAKPSHSHPPLLNLPPEQFFAELVRHYLFAALHEIFYTSLMAENQRRIQHLEGAIQRLEEKTAELARHSRTLRQEEITEEIEVILLSVEGAIQRV
ncbi:MAG: F0F1 ATP synthase subunit gamma, partial [Methylococcaceae bacterium]|nr:F0F1 ATP synthase subunit gamma [Methylococcaceae bacterium]